MIPALHHSRNVFSLHLSRSATGARPPLAAQRCSMLPALHRFRHVPNLDPSRSATGAAVMVQPSCCIAPVIVRRAHQGLAWLLSMQRRLLLAACRAACPYLTSAVPQPRLLHACMGAAAAPIFGGEHGVSRMAGQHAIKTELDPNHAAVVDESHCPG